MAEAGSHLPALLVAGVGPVPPESPDRLYAPGLRLWGMASELARAGHAVRMIEGLFGEAQQKARVFDLSVNSGEVALPSPRELTLPSGGWPEFLAQQARDCNAAAAIASTDVMNHALAAGGLSIPQWLDYFGDPMAERQMLAAALRSDDGLAAQWEMYAPALARADRISGCSAEQAAAILGHLGAIGRLNQFTSIEPLVQVLKPWISPLPAATDNTPRFRGRDGNDGFPADAFTFIQTGGFNAWLDEATLFAALESAMAQAPNLHFACTGGAIAGHYVQGFERFAQRIAASPHRARFHLLGWVALADIPRLLAEADAAINVDLPCAEGQLGTRNRLLDWVLAGLPTLTTPGSPLARELAKRNAAELLPHGDANLIAAALVCLAREGHRPTHHHITEGVARDFAPAHQLRPLLEWAAAPRRAPDLQAWEAGRAQPPALWVAARHADKTESARARLQELEGSRLVRWAIKLRKFKGLH